MLYQNARLYDEWKGEDYEGSSCRGAMKGLHKHGVCSLDVWPYGTKKKPGEPKPGWEDDAAKTPLGAYYRIQTDWIVAMQAAINEVHAIYVAASAHDGWDLGKLTDIDSAVIKRPTKTERGGHAFALVGYRDNGFIVQNSWGPDWGYEGFAILPYEDWLENGYDAWVLALGAPMLRVAKKSAATVQALVARAGQAAAAPAAGAAPALAGPPEPWGENAVARHTVVVGAGGRPVRQLVEASDEEDGVERVVAAAKASGLGHVALYAHGGLNDLETGLARARRWDRGSLQTAFIRSSSFGRRASSSRPRTSSSHSRANCSACRRRRGAGCWKSGANGRIGLSKRWRAMRASRPSGRT